MRGVVMHAPGQVSVEELPMPTIQAPTDAVIKIAAACVCGSDLWPYRGVSFNEPSPMGHEYVGEVIEVGEAVKTVKPGDFVVGSFCISCGECENCQAGYQSRCARGTFVSAGQGTQAEYARIPWADGTLVKTPARPNQEQLASLLAASDVLGTGWFAADAALGFDTKENNAAKTIAVVGDGAVGLSAVLAAKQLGAGRIVAFSRHPERQAVARKFGATDILEVRGDEAIAAMRELTGGYGAHGTAECVGTQQSLEQAIGSTRPGGWVGFVGVPHGVSLPLGQLFGSEVVLHGGPAPVRRYLPHLIDLIFAGEINPGLVFDQQFKLEDAAQAYAAMDERRAIKSLLTLD